MLHGMGIATGIDIEQTVSASRFILEALGKAAASKYVQAVESDRTLAHVNAGAYYGPQLVT